MICLLVLIIAGCGGTVSEYPCECDGPGEVGGAGGAGGAGLDAEPPPQEDESCYSDETRVTYFYAVEEAPMLGRLAPGESICATSGLCVYYGSPTVDASTTFLPNDAVGDERNGSECAPSYQ